MKILKAVHRLASLLLLLAQPAHAALSERDQEKMANALALFSKGAYAQAIEAADSIRSPDRETIATVRFFIGTARAKLQDFPNAAVAFQAAIRAGSREPSLHYDLGQALYAQQRLKEAEAEFRKSIVSKFKMGASAYYIAYIRSVLDDKPGARDFYSRITKLQNDPDKVKQSSLFQIAEMAYEEANELKSDETKKAQRKRQLIGVVQPLYRRARDYDPRTTMGEKAQGVIDEIEKELESMVERMRNGNSIPNKHCTLLVSQDFTYDSNVITQADQAVVQVSNKDALIWKTGMVGRYLFVMSKAITVQPELVSSVSYHSRRSTPSIFSNDNLSISPALRTKFEHWVKGFAATMQMDLEFNLYLRDYTFAHKFYFYTRYYNVALSERMKLFETGSTSVKAGLKLTEYYDPSKNSYAPSISVTQMVKVGWGVLVNTLSFDYLHARDDANDERNYKYRISTNFSDFIEKIDLATAIGTSLKDTMKQKGSRGNEFNLSPNVGLSRPFGKNLDGTLEYTWTKNFSNAKAAYQYTKGEIHFGLTYGF